MAKKNRKTTPVPADASPSHGNVITEETIVQGSPVPEQDQPVTRVFGGIQEEPGLMPLSVPVERVVQGLPPNAEQPVAAFTDAPAVSDGARISPDMERTEQNAEQIGSPGEPQSEAEPVFTEKDKTDLPKLEKKVRQHGLEQAEAIRDIRSRKLWMLHRGDDGLRRYTTFDEYIEDHWGHERQWATKQTKWLAVMKTLAILRSRGVDVPEVLTAKAVEGLYELHMAGEFQGEQEEQEEAGLIAVLQECATDGLPLNRDNLRAIRNRRIAFHKPRTRWITNEFYNSVSQEFPPKAETYEAYRADCAVVEGLQGVKTANVLGLKKEEVLSACKDQLALPKDEDLLHHFTGTELKETVDALIPLMDKFAVLQEQQKKEKELKEQVQVQRSKLKQMAEGMGVTLPGTKAKPTRNAEGDAKNDSDEGEESDVGEVSEELLQRLQANSNDFLASVRVQLEVIVLHLDEVQLDDERTKESLAAIIQAAHDIAGHLFPEDTE